MALHPGNNAWLTAAKQTDKATANQTAAFKLPFAGGNIGPIEDVVRPAETDSSRQEGDPYKVGHRVEGSPEHYFRIDDFLFHAYAVLGAVSTSGTTDKTHTITPAAGGALNYYTLHKSLDGEIIDEYDACRCAALSVRGSSGSLLTYSPTWFGLSTVFGDSAPSGNIVNTTIMSWPNVTCSIGGSAPGTVRELELTISNGGGPVPGDIGMALYDWVPGILSITGRMVLAFETDDSYRKFHTGSTSGTAAAVTNGTDDIEILIEETSVRSAQFDLADALYTAVDIAPDPQGAPMTMAIAFGAKRSATIANYLTITGKNQSAL